MRGRALSARTAAAVLPPALLALCLAVAAASASAQLIRDADCNGRVDAADRAAVVADLFAADVACAGADINRDGALTAADLIAYASGPRISFIGIASPDGRAADPLGTLPDGSPVYFRNAGFGFLLVVEALPPPDGAAIGTSTFESSPADPRRRPDFQIAVDRNLGDGSRDVCDEFGIPALDPLDFSFSQAASNTINDLACRFTAATRRSATCTQDAFGQQGFVMANSRAQFCIPVSGLMAFPTGDTRVSVQIRDSSGMLGPLQQMIVRVGSGPPPPTFTAVPPTETPVATATASATPTQSLTPTPSITRTTTRTRTSTRTASATHTAPPSPTRSITRTPTAPGTPTRTSTGPIATPTRTAASSPTHTATARSATPTRTATGPSATPTRTRTGPSATPTRTPSATTPTRTATRTVAGATPTRTRTASATATRNTPTSTRTPPGSPTPTVAESGPIITFFGLTRADDQLIEPTGMSGNIPVYEPLFGNGFSLIVEAKTGASRARPANSTFIGGAAPDLQIQATRPLGNGSDLVCDDSPPILGGVPAINPPNFGDDPSVADRLNDFGCRFVNGEGNPFGRTCGESTACVLGIDGQFGCVAPDTTVQFCGFIAQILSFPSGDTLVTARVRDVQGNLGPARQLILRIQ